MVKTATLVVMYTDAQQPVDYVNPFIGASTKDWLGMMM
jgi:hypothetical protein